MGNHDIEGIDAIYESHKDSRFENAKRVEDIPRLKAFQERLQARKYADILAEDVENWLSKQSPETKKHVNAIIRHLMAVSSYP